MRNEDISLIEMFLQVFLNITAFYNWLTPQIVLDLSIISDDNEKII